ncbi:MAG: PilN domain-containing protein, partial [Rhodoferax sp.]|nr:PilN domain-containing protein [Rhodoferax sp.]
MASTTSAQNYQDTLRSLKKQLLASRFLRWWLAELSSMVPAGMRTSGLDVALVTPIALTSDGVRAWQRQTFLAELEQAPAHQRDVLLVLGAERVLKKKMTLPLATEENLRQVLEFQIDQITPFSSAQVYFCHRVLSRDFERGFLSLEFIATPRDVVDMAVKKLTEWGVSVRGVVTQDMLHDTGNLVSLLPSAPTKTPLVWLGGGNRWLIAGVIVLLLAAMAMPLVIKRQAVVELLPWVDRGKRAAEAVDRVRGELENRVEQHNYLLEKKQALTPVILALEELAHVLPDDTWVQQLDIKGRELQIQGETASSVRLIGLFEKSDVFRDASFRSPLTKGQTAGAERYQLALQIQPMAVKPASPAASPASSPASAASAPAPAGPASAASQP